MLDKEVAEYFIQTLEDYREKSERSSFEAIDGMEWAETLADVLEELLQEVLNDR